MIGVIGCGNMASAIVKGIHKKFQNEEFLTFTPSYTRAQTLAEAVNGKAVKELQELKDCDVIIIACKPQQFQDLAKNLKEKLALEEKYFISIMAAISVETIQKNLNVKKVTRVMPNTPSLFNEGVSLIYHSSDVSSDQKVKCEKYFSACSQVNILDNELTFDKVTTVTGSGPAYVFYFAKTMADQLASWGIEEKAAREMVAQLFKGSTKLMEENTHRSWSELIDEVTSKGGVTIEAIKVYQEKGLDETTQDALAAAFNRSQVLTKQFE
jgi:pyrroline-5-carboxylate reductase